MPGPTETQSGPEVVPAAMFPTIDDALQNVIASGVPFRFTRLLLREDPKFDPVTVSWLPIEPVVADRPVMTGAGAAAVFSDTLSKVAVERPDAALLTAKPT